jgi:hypothetical protein
MRKIRRLLFFAIVLLSLFNFTNCCDSDTNKNSSHITKTELEKLEDNLNDTVQDYFNEKYGVQAVITHQSIAGGVFLGPDLSADNYYNLTINIVDGEYNVECNAEVYGRRADKESELYVKNESYYGKLMENKMIRWIDSYISKTGLKDYMIEYSGTHTCFPSEYSTDLTAEEFITLISKNENMSIKSSAYFILTIPESEYAHHENLSDELYELKSHLKQIDGGITLHLYVYNDMDFSQIKSGDNTHFNSIVSSKVLNYTE